MGSSQSYEVVAAGQDGVVGSLVKGNTLGGVSLTLSTEVEVRAGSSQRQEVNGRAGASSSDAERTA